MLKYPIKIQLYLYTKVRLEMKWNFLNGIEHGKRLKKSMQYWADITSTLARDYYRHKYFNCVLRISHTLAYVWSLSCGFMWMHFKIPQGHPRSARAHDQQKSRTYKANESMYSPLIPRSPKHSPRGIPRQRWSTAVTWVPRYTLMENKKYDKPFLAILEH